MDVSDAGVQRLQVLAMTSSERIMGPEFVNHWITRAVGWVIAAGILAINASDVYEFASSEVAGRSWMMVLLIVAVMLYLSFVLYLTIGPDRWVYSLLCVFIAGVVLCHGNVPAVY